MKKKKFLFVLSSFAMFCLITGCQEKTATASSSSNKTISSSTQTTEEIQNSSSRTTEETQHSGSQSSTHSSGSQSSSSTIPEPTLALTDAMLAGLNQGYRAEVFAQTKYEGASTSAKILDLSVNEFNASIQVYTTEKDKPLERYHLTHDYHYQINPTEEGTKMLYDAGLSIGNDVIYSPVLGKDPHTYEEIELTWDEGYYSNAFKDIRASHFTRINNDENAFSLNLNEPSLLENHTYDKIMWQLFNENINAECESFILKTDGDQIIGFELTYETTSSSETFIQSSSYGNFLAFGSDVVDFVKPLQGEEDQTFKAAIDQLKALNFAAEQTQQNYDFNQEKFYVSGIYKYKIEDGNKIDYDIYSNATTKYANGGYYGVVDDETQVSAKQSVVKIEDEFYKDYIYSGSMEEFLPDFNISSLCFIKDNSSTETKQVWKLNNEIRFSLDNYITAFSPFDSDGYPDRLIYLTITIENDQINIHNETVDQASDRGGLIFDATYSQFGEIQDLMPETKIHDSCDDLTWSQLLSNNEQGSKNLMSSFSKDVIDSLPTIGNGHSDVYVDGKILFIYTYDLNETKELLAEYQAKLENADYEVLNVNQETLETTLKSKNKVTISNRQYYMNITLSIWWNSIMEFGQFQIALSLTSK